MTVPVRRSEILLRPDPRRVITKPFDPGGDSPAGRLRTQGIVARIVALSEAEVEVTLASVRARYHSRHADIDAVFAANAVAPAHHTAPLSDTRRALIGAYFTHEYSIESAALTNPSMVPAPDGVDVADGHQRFILSLRGIGEGHISSIQFRGGIIDSAGHIVMDEIGPHLSTARHCPPTYEKAAFRAKLIEIHTSNELSERVLSGLPARFAMDQLEHALAEATKDGTDWSGHQQVLRTIHWLASSNYDSTFAADSALSDRIIFPAGPNESHGTEDARFVRFTYDDGTVTYFATYTAFNGFEVMPQLIETPDFVTFRIATLVGPGAKNKGVALFPRLINGQFVALSRLDNENNFIMRSDNVRLWGESSRIQVPKEAWELTQLGNCGSPLETEAGWLVITHGVGPMREYSLGAILLDKDDPTKVIGHLKEPLLTPREDERDGYVPNVVYSCGSMLFGDMLVLPYGFADIGTRIATVDLGQLLTHLTES